MSDSYEKPLENLMKSTMENLRDMVDVNTVIGDPVQTKDGTCIIPVSKLNFGFVSGGSEFSSPTTHVEDDIYPFGGGSGAGVSVRPVAFLVIKEDSVRLIPVDHDTPYDRVFDNVPQVIDMVSGFIKDLCDKSKKKVNINFENGNNNDEVSNTSKIDSSDCD
ncbi:MAG TPA: sporulation protein YtfJ [Clostridium sp.]|nr:sporulation protein YtfJ [Clostridium sp.]